MPAKELIATITVGSGGAASIDFTSIPQTYTDLQLVFAGRNTVDSVEFRIQFNSDTGANYPFYRIYGSGTTTATSYATPTYLPYYGASASSFSANSFGNSAIYIPNYTGSTYKIVSGDTFTENSGSESYLTVTAGRWNNTAAINAIKVSPSSSNFAQYSTASLYGITKGNGGATVS